MKNSLEGLNSRFEQREERIKELEDKPIEIIKYDELKEKRREKSEQSLKNLWAIIVKNADNGNPQKRGERGKGRKCLKK